MAGAPAASLNYEGEAMCPGRRATREKGPGPLRLRSSVPALDRPYSSLCLHNKETPVLFKLLLFWVSCHLQPKKKKQIRTDKIPEKKKTKTEKQREIRGRIMRMSIDLVHGVFRA